MQPRHMLERIGPKTLVIVPGDREDVITTLTSAHLAGLQAGHGSGDQLAMGLDRAGVASGLVLTGGYRPRPAVLAAIRDAHLFAIAVDADTYAVASDIHDLLVKTHPSDLEKIDTIKQLVATNLDVDRLLEVATEAVSANGASA
jgi:BioD-like phosphotransacetylase family protein